MFVFEYINLRRKECEIYNTCMCKDFFEANLSSSAFFKVDFYLCLLADLSRVSFAVLPL